MCTDARVQDALLIEAPASALSGGPDGLAQTLVAIAHALPLEAVSVAGFRGVEQDRFAGYIWTDHAGEVDVGAALRLAGDLLGPSMAAGELELTRLQGVTTLAGADSATRSAVHYVVRTDIAPEYQSDLEAWYDEAHLPGLAACPGNVLSRRLISLDKPPRYYACYDLVSTAAVTGSDWLKERASEWSGRVRPRFVNTRRTMFDNWFERRI